MRTSPGFRGIYSAVALTALLGWGGMAALGSAESEEESPGFLASKGRVTFRTYCASCHGREADGSGNIAQYLTVKPADLTRISERRDGEFPLEWVRTVIDGREPVKGHGSGEMPVWGDVFQSSVSTAEAALDETGEERAERKVRELAYYLRSIQVEADAE